MVSPDLLSLDPDALARSEERLRQQLNVGAPRRTVSPTGRPNRGRSGADVPVVMVQRRQTAVHPAEEPADGAPAEALRHEREAREQAEQALRQAQQTIRHLQAQLAHAEIAHAEAVAAEQQARERAEEAAREAHEKLEALSRATSRRRPRTRPDQAAPDQPAPNQPAVNQPGPAVLEADDPTDGPAPVEWWRPGWRQRP